MKGQSCSGWLTRAKAVERMKTDTSRSLLDRLRNGGNPRDWESFCSIYQPLIRRRLLSAEVREGDADDLIQEILARVFRGFQSFTHNGRKGAFRRWLGRIIAHESWRHFQARDRKGRQESGQVVSLDEIPDGLDGLDEEWQVEHDRHVVRRLLDLIRPEFSDTTWNAFRLTAVQGRETDTVALELGISENAVVIARCRVLRRLRLMGRDLVDWLGD